MKTVKLSPGRYVFVCPCGDVYEEFTSRGDDKAAIYCFGCKQSNGKYIKIMEQKLEFSYNWNNKLNNTAFSTLRLRNDRAYFKGARFDVYLKGIFKGKARVEAVNHFTIDKITEFVARIDTGYSASECRKIIREMYKNRPGINWETQQLAFSLLVYEGKEEMNDLFGNRI